MPRILQITDLHVLPRGTLAYGRVDTAGALERTVTAICAALTRIGPIDLVVVTGDLTDGGTAEEYATCRAILSTLPVDLLALPGNHDDREAMRAAFAQAPWMPPQGHIYWRRDIGDTCLIGLDTLVPGAPHGEVGPAQLDWLAEQVPDLQGCPLTVALHHPPIVTGMVQMDRQGLRDAEALSEVLTRHDGPCRIIAGHVHRMVTGFLGRVPVITAPGTSHAVALDLQPARNACFDMEPGGVLIHEMDASLRSHLLPVGPFGGPYPFAG